MVRLSRLSFKERLAFLQETYAFSEEEIALLSHGGKLPLSLADSLIENAIGFYALPLGLISGVCLNKKTYVVPLVTEETSVIAALQKTARWVCKQKGEVCATSLSPSLMIGQIHIPRLKDTAQLQAFLRDHKNALFEKIHQGPAHAMWKRGGGVKDLLLRVLPRPDGGEMGVIHVHMDVREAMGANIVTQVCEFLKAHFCEMLEEKMGMAIVSNLADQKLVRVWVRIPNVPASLGEALSEASLFAQLDPYRAVTHNKGLLNGMDGVTIATGNDWRAVEAALHGFAAQNGTYRGLSTWAYQQGILEGFFEGPIPVGLVGGTVGVHPGAQLSLKILRVQTAEELAHVIGCVGLLQNLGALRALVKEGLVQGHMALHIDNILLGMGLPLETRQGLKPLLQKRLKENGFLGRKDVETLLQTGQEP